MHYAMTGKEYLLYYFEDSFVRLLFGRANVCTYVTKIYPNRKCALLSRRVALGPAGKTGTGPRGAIHFRLDSLEQKAAVCLAMCLELDIAAPGPSFGERRNGSPL